MRLDGGHDLGDVAHVAGAHLVLRGRGAHALAELLQVLLIDRVEGGRDHGVLHAVLVGLQPAPCAGHRRRALDHAHRLLIDRLEPRRRGRTQVELGLGVVGHDVGRVAAADDDAVDAHVARQVLAQGVEAVIGQNQAVQRVDAVLRAAGRVRRPAPELDVHRRAPQAPGRQDMLARARMHAQRRVHVAQVPLAHEAALGAAVFAALLAGRAVHAHLAAHLVHDLAKRRRRQRRGRAEQVVPAPVPQAAQRVVLGQKHHDRASLFALIARVEAGSVPGHVHLYLKALPPELLGQRFAGEKLIVADLRPRVNLPRNPLVGSQLPVYIFDDLFTIHIHPPRVGSADSRLLPRVLLTNSGSIDWTSRILRIPIALGISSRALPKSTLIHITHY